MDYLFVHVGQQQQLSAIAYYSELNIISIISILILVSSVCIKLLVMLIGWFEEYSHKITSLILSCLLQIFVEYFLLLHSHFILEQ